MRRRHACSHASKAIQVGLRPCPVGMPKPFIANCDSPRVLRFIRAVGSSCFCLTVTMWHLVARSREPSSTVRVVRSSAASSDATDTSQLLRAAAQAADTVLRPPTPPSYANSEVSALEVRRVVGGTVRVDISQLQLMESEVATSCGSLFKMPSSSQLTGPFHDQERPESF